MVGAEGMTPEAEEKLIKLKTTAAKLKRLQSLVLHVGRSVETVPSDAMCVLILRGNASLMEEPSSNDISHMELSLSNRVPHQ